MNISYRTATVDDRDKLVELLTKHFYPNEPFNCGWVNDDPVPEDLEFILACVGEGTSFIATDEARSAIVGACITGVDEASSTQALLEEALQTTNEKWSQYLRLYALFDTDANIFQRFSVEKTFHVHCLTVDRDYRGRSIATKLVEASLEKAKFLGHKMCSINCSSIYTAQIAVKLKMECIGELAMDDMRDEKGDRLIFPPPPHTHVRTYAKRL